MLTQVYGVDIADIPKSCGSKFQLYKPTVATTRQKWLQAIKSEVFERMSNQSIELNQSGISPKPYVRCC
jgi:hypothetical protein